MAKESVDISKVERLLTLFKPERYSYLVICLLSCLTLISLAVYQARGEKPEMHLVLGMFGSSGVIAVAMGRMMKMWNDVMKVMFKVNTDEDEHEQTT